GQRFRSVLGNRGSDFREIEPCGKMIPVRKHNAGAQILVGAERFIRSAELLNGRQIERVALLRAIDPDEQHVAFTLDGDAVFHLVSPREYARCARIIAAAQSLAGHPTRDDSRAPAPRVQWVNTAWPAAFPGGTSCATRR